MKSKHHRVSKQRGYILPMMLIIFQIFSLISLNNLMYTTDLMTMTRQFWKKDQYLHTARQILHGLETQMVFQLPTCVMKVMSNAQLSKMPVSWWQQYGCGDRYNGIDYYYIVENLGTNPCRTIGKNKHNDDMIVEYHRITLFMLLDKAVTEKLLLQSTFVRPIIDHTPCLSTMYDVSLGSQMWREI